jgi:DNA-binding NarL/FixJ family response regulator
VIRLLLAEDHPVVRAGLEKLLSNEPDIDLVGAAADGAEAVELTERLRPDVVLMDLSMPVLDGTGATRQIHAAHDGAIAVVILTSFSDRAQIMEALDAGASGYLLKDAEPEEIVRGIRAAARGESPLAPKAAHAVLTARAERPAVELSAREREVLLLLAQGLPNKLIARRLEITEKTVKSHLTRVFREIGVTDRTQAALWAERNGLGVTTSP